MAIDPLDPEMIAALTATDAPSDADRTGARTARPLARNGLIAVLGAGIIGLWQALTLARAGFRVTLYEQSPTPYALAASRWAGAMLAPDCEAEAGEPIIRPLGHRGIALWQAALPDLITARGSLVLAPPRDTAELKRYARATSGHQTLGADAIASLEPDLAGRFPSALYFAQEAHIAPRPALDRLIAAARAHGATIHFGQAMTPDAARAAGAERIIDARGLAARDHLPGLRGVRGEMLAVKTAEIRLSRPVRLIHPRFPIYVVPWGGDHYMVGATVIERDDAGPVTARSAAELLGSALALHPGFGEAEIIELGAGVRPALPDNLPRVVTAGDHIHVNGAYRHGFLLAPVLAEVVAHHLLPAADRHAAPP